MTVHRFFILLFFFPVASVAAEGATSSPSPSPSPVSQGAASPVSEPALPRPSDLLSGVIEDYTYNPEGKRDPFAPFEGGQSGVSFGPLFPLQKYDLDQLKLAGIIWDVQRPKALIMDPLGRGHVVKLNDRIGRNNGYVARIREGEIVIIESVKGQGKKAVYQTQVIKLENNE